MAYDLAIEPILLRRCAQPQPDHRPGRGAAHDILWGPVVL